MVRWEISFCLLTERNSALHNRESLLKTYKREIFQRFLLLPDRLSSSWNTGKQTKWRLFSPWIRWQISVTGTLIKSEVCSAISIRPERRPRSKCNVEGGLRLDEKDLSWAGVPCHNNHDRDDTWLHQARPEKATNKLIVCHAAADWDCYVKIKRVLMKREEKGR